jgi:flagellar hook-associated protein 2
MGLRIGSVTFSGLASGIASDRIIEQILQLERRPIAQLERRRDDLNARLSIFSDLREKTTALRDQLRRLDNLALLGTTQSAEEEFSKLSATSTNPNVVTATATGLAQPGTLTLRVTQLAAAERRISAGFASENAAVGTGTFSIQVGSNPATNVEIDASNDSVAGLVQAINDANAGVTASILDDGDPLAPIRIVIQGSSTGSANALTINDGLTGGTNPVFAITQSARNAAVVIDPDDDDAVTVQSATNTFSNILSGLTIQVKSASADGTSEVIEVATDVDAVVNAIQNLVGAFNDVTSVIQGQFQIDPSTSRGGPLIGDSTLTSLKQRLASAVVAQIGSGSITSAAQIGIRLDTRSGLTLDEDTLRSALAAGFSNVRSFFAGSGGLADQLRSVADAFVDSVNGGLVARIDGTSLAIQEITEQIARGEDRLSTVEDSLVRQFATLERLVSSARVQGDFLNRFLTQQSR